MERFELPRFEPDEIIKQNADVFLNRLDRLVTIRNSFSLRKLAPHINLPMIDLAINATYNEAYQAASERAHEIMKKLPKRHHLNPDSKIIKNDPNDRYS